jgi:PPOX class probable F420-dependent enzyme
MAKKRDRITMTAEEIAAFLAAERVVNVATIGRDGWPHVTALWFVMRGTEPWIYTYAKSQKIRNLERDGRATLLVEAGEQYDELRGVMLKARAEVHHDLGEVTAVAEEIFAKYQGGHGAIDDTVRDALRAQAAKRAAVRFRLVETVSWDHSKLGGAY